MFNLWKFVLEKTLNVRNTCLLRVKICGVVPKVGVKMCYILQKVAMKMCFSIK